MPKSMWCCSGRHWLRVAATWSAFALCLYVAVGASPEPQAGLTVVAPVGSVRLEVAGPSGTINLNVHALDLAELDDAAFGDHHQ